MTVMLGYYLGLDWLPDNSDLFVMVVGMSIFVVAAVIFARAVANCARVCR